SQNPESRIHKGVGPALSHIFPQHGKKFYTGSNTILTLRPKARAALPKVFSVTEALEASSNRSTAARLVFIREIPEVASAMVFFAHRFCKYCFLRFFASSSSSGGVFCCFLMKPCSSTI